jgi:NAD dependent epimerase/dehydratase
MPPHAITARDKVLVTGAGGFIGSHLTDALTRAGADVCALVRYNSRNDWGHLEGLDKELLRSIRVVRGDVCDPYSLRSVLRGRTLVFHLAALIGIPYSYSAPAAYVSTNVGGTLHVLQAALDLGLERVIHTSTSEVYGTARYVPIDENHPLQGQSPYSASKIGADKLVESFHASFEMPVVTIRPFNTFGPRQSARAIIPTIITQALAGEVVRLGSLSPVRDLTYVEDTVRGFLLAAKADGVLGTVINLGSGSGISIGVLAQRIFGLLGIQRRIEEDQERLRPASSEVMKLIASAQKAQDLLGWSPSIELNEGLSRTIEWLKSNLSSYKIDDHNV